MTEASKSYVNEVAEYEVTVATDFSAANDAKSFTVKAVDIVGNESVASEAKVITFDQTPPTITVSQLVTQMRLQIVQRLFLEQQKPADL